MARWAGGIEAGGQHPVSSWVKVMVRTAPGLQLTVGSHPSGVLTTMDPIRGSNQSNMSLTSPKRAAGFNGRPGGISGLHSRPAMLAVWKSRSLMALVPRTPRCLRRNWSRDRRINPRSSAGILCTFRCIHLTRRTWAACHGNFDGPRKRGQFWATNLPPRVDTRADFRKVVRRLLLRPTLMNATLVRRWRRLCP